MAYSRRMMMGGMVGTAAAGVVASGGFGFMSVADFWQVVRPVENGRRGVALASATVDDWSLQKGSLFTVDSGEILELVDVQRFPDHPGRPRDLRPSAFTSTFEVKRGNPLTEARIYRLNHREGGEFDLRLEHHAEIAKRMFAVLN